MDTIWWNIIGLAFLIIVLPFLAHALIYLCWYRNWRCPRCRTKTLETENEDGDVYRICPKCGEKWLVHVEKRKDYDED